MQTRSWAFWSKLFETVLGFIKLGRFTFLAGGFALYGLGVAIALYSGATINLRIALWGQIIVSATQLMVHYSNDFYDFETDKKNQTPTAWSGGSRVLQAGLFPRRIAQIAAIIFALVAVFSGILLAIFEQPGVLVVPIVLLAVVLSWEYSSPPLKFHSRGIGEIGAAFIVSVLTPVLGFYLQTNQITPLLLLAILPLYPLQLNMLISVDIPDAEGDEAANKRTLVVRLGRPTIVRLCLVLLLSAYGLLALAVWGGLPSLVALGFSLTIPLAVWLMWRSLKGEWLDQSRWDRLIFWSIGLLMSAAVLELLSFVWLSIMA